MQCPRCGRENDGTIKFCGFCGAKMPEHPEKGKKNEKKKRRKWCWILLAVLLLAAAVVLAGIWVMRRQKEKAYRRSLNTAEKYLQELDYEKAEASYLEAISISPKEKEPYLKLTELYLVTGEKEKAQSILREAKENLPEAEQEEIQEIEKTTENLEDYTWIVEPAVEADDMYYLKESDSYEYSANEMERQMFSEYAVIVQDGTYGLIDMSGDLLEGMVYDKVDTLAGYYLMTRKEPVYVPEFGTEMKEFYIDDLGEIRAAVAVVGDVYGFKGAFYYCGGLHNIGEAYGENMIGPATWTTPKEAIPVKQSDTLFTISGSDRMNDWITWYNGLPGLYGVYKENAMVTDPIYEKCGSAGSGLLAVEKDGKWGYIDEDGNVVIPLEYDASWSQYIPVGSENAEAYCYAASGGYVTLVKDGVWELRNTQGELVIYPGVFEKILPVFEGRCWVRQNGRWGVIELSPYRSEGAEDEEPDQEVEEEPDQETEKEEPALEARIDLYSAEQVKEAVIAQLNAALLEDDGATYTIMDSETTESNAEYQFMLRYAMSDKEAEEIMARGGTPSANQLVGMVTVKKETGEAVFSPMAGEEIRWNLND